jgi:hypothetical protein
MRHVIRVGEKYGLLTVIAEAGLKSVGRQQLRYFNCQCRCGHNVCVQGRLLTAGNTTSCGCKLQRYKASLKGKPQCRMQTGQKWNYLTLVRWVRTEKHHALCEFLCACGSSIITSLQDVKHGNIKSCGCLRKEQARRMGNRYGPKLKLPIGQSGFNRLFRQYRYQALHRKIAFSLDLVTFSSKTKADCYYCGKPAGQFSEGSSNKDTHYVYNGLDRVNNALGYTVENTVPCCADCNRAKRTRIQDEFIAWAKRIAARFP